MIPFTVEKGRVYRARRQLLPAWSSAADERAIGRVLQMVHLHDNYTVNHQSRVARLAAAIGHQLELPKRTVHTLWLGGMVHDIGKVGVPADVLTKPEPLSELERTLVEQHPMLGNLLLEASGAPAWLQGIAAQHHERLDGSGYPEGLQAPAICLEARIIAVADVVDAMTKARPYRPALGLDAALAEVNSAAGVRYDRSVVEACTAVFATGFTLEDD